MFVSTGTVLVMALNRSEPVRFDGDAVYRYLGTGTRAVLVPTVCRRHEHRLGESGYRITEGEGVLRVRCESCASAGQNDHSWVLRSAGPVASVAELDDDAYDLPARST